MDYMLMPLRRYADFSGRSQRQEYWMFALFQVLLFGAGIVLLLVLAGTADPSLGGKSSEAPAGALIGIGLLVLLYLFLFIPNLAVQARRFHDQDLSGWFVLLGFIPYLGGLIMFVFMCIDGTAGTNRFGPDPKGRGATEAQIFA